MPPQAERATLTISSAIPRVGLKVFIVIVSRKSGAALRQIVRAEIGRHQAGEVGHAEEIAGTSRRFDLQVAIALDQRACATQTLFARGDEVGKIAAKQHV